MSITKIPVRTVYDGSENPLGLAEFQVGEVIPISSGGTSADTVANAKINLQLTDLNIRSLFSVTGGGTFDSSTGVIDIVATDLTPYAKTVDLTTANVSELTNLYYTNARVSSFVTPSLTTSNVIETTSLYYTEERANLAVDNRVTKSFVDSLNVDADTLDGLDSSAFALDTDLTTSNVIETTNLYYTNARVSSFVTPSLTTSNVIETTNLYYTNARVDAYINESITTTDVNEGDNLYYTITRANTAIDNRVTKSFVDNLNIDADTLDGLNATAFALDTDLTTANVIELTNLYFTFDRARGALAGNSVSIGELTVSGNLFVQGNTTTLNTATLTIQDKNIVLANGSVSSEASDGAGITVDGSQANIVYLNSGNRWFFNRQIETSNITTSGTITSDGNITSNGHITSPFFYSESDIALKENVQPINNALDKVLNMFGVSFDWKSNKTKSIGVIAQEVEKVVPEIVSVTNGHKTVSYDSIIPILIEAIKEQQTQIDKLKKKLND